jgi:hypothetical protein
MQCELNMQCISFLPRYLILISTRGFLRVIEYAEFPQFNLMSNEFKRNWMKMVVTQISILP